MGYYGDGMQVHPVSSGIFQVSLFRLVHTVTESKKNCSIYAASSTTFDTRNNQAVILRTDYSSNEFFVVEYRKQKAKYDVASYDDKSYEGKIYGSGLIIYRINASLIGGNMYGPPYKAYVFSQVILYLMAMKRQIILT